MSDVEDHQETSDRASQESNRADPGNGLAFSPEDALAMFSRK